MLRRRSRSAEFRIHREDAKSSAGVFTTEALRTRSDRVQFTPERTETT
jgi:hypothetical protein